MGIKELRIKTNMTQKEFAEYFSIPQRTIENWEGGQRKPPEYVLELIKYKIEKERLGMTKDLGEFKLKETNEYEYFYVAVMDTDVMVTTDRYDLYPYDTVGKIKVYHDGLYFGTPDDMYNWIENEVRNYLIEKKVIIEDGETVMGEKLWKWN